MNVMEVSQDKLSHLGQKRLLRPYNKMNWTRNLSITSLTESGKSFNVTNQCKLQLSQNQ